MVDKVYPSTPVHCRVCKKAIDRNAETDWVMASRNYYFHNDCYEKWKHSTNIDDDQYWIELIYDFIKRDLKVEYNYFMCENQRLKYVQKNGFTNRGIYFTLKYFPLILPTYKRGGKEWWQYLYQADSFVYFFYFSLWILL